MNRLAKAAVLVKLVGAMRDQGSWCGETHIQKATFFLQRLAEVPLEFDFVLYKYGPYSFSLNDELTAHRADQFLDFTVRDPRYGPSYEWGELAVKLLQDFPNTIRRYDPRIQFIAEQLGDSGVADLERLSTALYVKCADESHGMSRKMAKHVVKLKPHISLESAQQAVNIVEHMAHESRRVVESRSV